MNDMARLLVVNAPDFAGRAADVIHHSLQAAVSIRGRASFVLAGGETPRSVYKELAGGGFGEASMWDRVDFYQGDERCVAPDDPLSNFRMISESLFQGPFISLAMMHRMEAEDPDRDRAALRYQSILPQSADLILLGIGSDGHIASLFPYSEALRSSSRYVTPSIGASPPVHRLTITPRVIGSARQIIVLARGREKSWAVCEALEGPEDIERCPAQLVRRRGVWILDEEAASAVRHVY